MGEKLSEKWSNAKLEMEQISERIGEDLSEKWSQAKREVETF